MRFTIRLYILQSFTLLTLLNPTYGAPLIGDYRDAKSGEFPFAVSIGKRSDVLKLPLEILQFCTGTLITDKHVLTAEHCLIDEQINTVEIIIGAVDLRDGEKYYPSSWLSYQKWKTGKEEQYLIHDIAILTLGKSVDTSKISPAKLVLSVPFALPGADVKVAGWGELEDGRKSTIMKTAIFKLIAREECEMKIRDLTYDSFALLQQDMCSVVNPLALLGSGDSGGPLLDKKNYLVGINMAVVPKNTKYNDSGAALERKQVNSHISIYYYQDFIRYMTKKHLPTYSVV